MQSPHRTQHRTKGKKSKSQSNQADFFSDNILDFPSLGKIRTTADIKPQTVNQRRYVQSIHENMVTLVLAPAGCGKTLLGLYNGVKLFNSDTSPIDHILYVRSIVENSEERGIGFLTGDKAEKLAPYYRPAVDNLKQFMSDSEAEYLFQGRRASIDIPEFLEGRSLRNTFVFFDEAHASSKSTLNMVLERLGEGSKLVIAGWPSQRKNRGLDPLESLANAVRFAGLPSWGLIEMNQSDNLRNGLYREWEPTLCHWLNKN